MSQTHDVVQLQHPGGPVGLWWNRVAFCWMPLMGSFVLSATVKSLSSCCLLEWSWGAKSWELMQVPWFVLMQEDRKVTNIGSENVEVYQPQRRWRMQRGSRNAPWGGGAADMDDLSCLTDGLEEEEHFDGRTRGAGCWPVWLEQFMRTWVLKACHANTLLVTPLWHFPHLKLNWERCSTFEQTLVFELFSCRFYVCSSGGGWVITLFTEK